MELVHCLTAVAGRMQQTEVAADQLEESCLRKFLEAEVEADARCE